MHKKGSQQEAHMKKKLSVAGIGNSTTTTVVVELAT